MKVDSQARIYIICPANNSTGGPEALHQLCHKLRTVFCWNAEMFYVKKKAQKDPKPEAYDIYDTVEAQEIIDETKNIVIIPESLTNYIYKYSHIQKIIWWLSVDFYEICMKNRHRGSRFYWGKYILGKKEEQEYLLEDLPDVFHWAQSYRSYDYLMSKGVKETKIRKVCDYMNPLFLKRARQNIISEKKEDIIIYNPKKGKKEIESIRDKCPEYQWIPIKNMTPVQVSELMGRAKLYIDFGNNPGRDRMLRESALMKCIIISGKNGSSGYQQDLNIPEKYKFEYSEDMVPEIKEKIKDVLNNYEFCISDFESYVQETLQEEENFEKQLQGIFNKELE